MIGEWVAIINCELSLRNDLNKDELALYYEDMVYIYETDNKIFDAMKDMIKGE